ncbi:MAG: ABC transporter substrate-binding protein, partial [Pseudorhodoplanes sp.]
AKYGRAPSAYAAQGYDSIQLIGAAADALKGDLSDKNKIKAALREAKYSSVRGPYSYNTNNFPIQDFYLTNVEKRGDELVLNTVSKAVEKAKDVYAAECPMK